MKQHIIEQIESPPGVICEFSSNIFKCMKDGLEVSKEINVPCLIITINGNKINLECLKGNKIAFKTIKSHIAHIKNMFLGLQNEYVYKLESCNVHFPITMKVEADKFIINNFLGEKTPRIAKIIKGAKVEIKGQKITVTSANKESAGQTAANLEKATKIKNRDRRIFQDGIFITDRPGGDGK